MELWNCQQHNILQYTISTIEIRKQLKKENLIGVDMDN